MNAYIKNLILLHVVVFIFGFTGVLGKLISLTEDQLVWWRMCIACISVATFMLAFKHKFSVGRKAVAQLLLTGLIISAHWITFFGAIKASNVSIALACMSTSALFTAIVKPLFHRERIVPYELVLGVLVIVGLVLIFRSELQFANGIYLGIISAFLASVFTVINAGFVKQQSPSAISFYEMLGGIIGITAYLAAIGKIDTAMFQLEASDLLWLLLLGIVCTAFAFLASVLVMRQLSPFTVSLSINLEPVYGILIAILIWPESETMSTGFYAGTVLILSTLVANAWLKRRKRVKG